MKRSSDKCVKPASQHVRAVYEGGEDYRELFENALEGIYRSTPAGRFLTVNPALVRMLGYDSAAEVLALKLPEDLYVDPDERERARVRIEDKSEVRGAELHWKKKNGEILLEPRANSAFTVPTSLAIVQARALLDEVEREKLRAALDSTRNNRVQAAKLLGMSRSTFYEKLKRYHLTI